MLEVAAAVPRRRRAARSPPRTSPRPRSGKTLLYDKAGDEHYGVVSAFIKSMRGSDPDAAVYWMTRMLEAGEDPRFVLRRMVIFASEDVGNADPQALVGRDRRAVDAFELVGLPEGVLPMTAGGHRTSRTRRRSNTRAHHVRGARKATSTSTARCRCPRTCATRRRRSASRSATAQGYKYPHDFEGHYVREEYLPEPLRGHRYYTPSDSGLERELAARLAALKPKK